MVADCVHRLEQRVDPVLLGDLSETHVSRVNCRDLCLQVADRALGEAAVEPDDVEDVAPFNAPLVDPDRGEEDALLRHVRRVENVACVLLFEIEQVDPAGRETDQRARRIDRAKHEDIERVRRRPIRVIEHEHVTARHVLSADELNRPLHAELVRAREDRDPWGFSDGVAVRVVQTDTVVVDLIDDGVVRGTTQIAGHLLRRREHAVPDDLGGDRVDHVNSPSQPL